MSEVTKQRPISRYADGAFVFAINRCLPELAPTPVQQLFQICIRRAVPDALSLGGQTAANHYACDVSHHSNGMGPDHLLRDVEHDRGELDALSDSRSAATNNFDPLKTLIASSSAATCESSRYCSE